MKVRDKVLVITSSVLLFGIFSSCVWLQIFNQNKYLEKAVSFVTDTVTTPAIRGKITDCNNIPLATNKLCLSVEIGAGVSKDDYIKLKEMLGFDSEKHQMGEGFVVRDVPSSVASAVAECGFKNVHIIRDYKREYITSVNLSHIIGYTGAISSEEFDKLRAEGYSSTDIIGKSGVEKAMENKLRGTDGKRVLKNDKKVFERNAIEGCTVKLTVDSALQDVVETELSEQIGQVEKDTGFMSGGAVVVLDVNSGAVLAMASAPDYSVEGLSKNYDTLVSDASKPLLNRCISGCYEPGSTFKPLVALAALNEGLITPYETIYDMGVYRFYEPTYMPSCHIWNEKGKTHGDVNVVEALSESCNYYFFEIGRRLGINKIKQYAEEIGFGEKCGIEIEGEVSGTLASPEVKEWYDGDTLQAAIGQSVNMFTPLQLACFSATLASDGKIYSPYILSEVVSADGRLIRSSEPVLKGESSIKDEYFNIVKNGMRACVLSGTASSVFENYDFSCGGKTGTAQVPSGPENGLFIGFAPYENPEIAVSVVIEHGAGEYPSHLAAEIMEKYLKLYP